MQSIQKVSTLMAIQEVVDPQINVPSAALNKSSAHFARPSGSDLLGRTAPFLRWHDVRLEAQVWPYSRCLTGAPHTVVTVQDEGGRESQGLNFASQDYLALATHPAITQAAMQALRDFGPHSASSPVLQGNTTLSLRLEAAISELVAAEHVALFPTGWGAGFGTIVGLIRSDDHVILDNLAHACLQQGAHAATNNVLRHAHLDTDGVLRHLQTIRARDTKNGILVVTEGLFSMDSDSPDLNRMQALCHEYEATLLVDVAHDLGALGPGGTGHLGLQHMLGKADLVVGAFSKTFASNGGFLATHSRAVKQYVKTFGGTHTFSNGLSPVEAAVVTEAIRIVVSEEGSCLRADLLDAVLELRHALAQQNLHCLGAPSAVVPVPIGNEKLARLASMLLLQRGVLANLVEFPAVAVGSARFRMQVMAAHTPEQIQTAAQKVTEAIHDAQNLCRTNTDLGHAVVNSPS